MSHIIGIDVGTSGIKVAAMDREGNLPFLEYKSHELDYPQHGWVEIKPKEVWSKIEELLNLVCNKVEREGKIDALSLSCFCNSSIFMNEEGEAISKGIMYLDQRSEKEAEDIKRSIGKQALYEETRNRLDPGMYSVTSHLWFKNNYPENYRKSYKWGNISTYILYQLAGNFVMDWTQASFSGIYDIKNYEWSDTLCDNIGIDYEKLPKIVDPQTIIGYFKTRNGSKKDIPVVAGGADTACSALALGIQPKEVFESVGTSNVLTVCTDDVSTLDSRFLNRSHILKNQWLSHGAMSTPGAAIHWFYEQFLKPEGYNKDILETFPYDSKIGANGLYFLPYMQGERSPIWDPKAKGAFIGLNLKTTKSDMYQALLEGCSFGLRQIYEIINMNYSLEISGIQSIGGGAKNRTWAQMKANVLNEKILVKDVSETSVLGACMIAGKSVNYFNSFEDCFISSKNKTIEEIMPQKDVVTQYENVYSAFCEIYPLLQTFFKKNN